MKKEAEDLLDDVVEIEAKAPAITKVELPHSLKKFEGDPILIEQLDGMKDIGENGRKKIFLEQADPDRLAFMAYKLREEHDILQEILQRLNEIKESDAEDVIKQKADNWLKVIM